MGAIVSICVSNLAQVRKITRNAIGCYCCAGYQQIFARKKPPDLRAPGRRRSRESIVTVEASILTTGSLTQKTALAQRFSLFAGVPPSDCASILSVAREKTYARRQTIFAEGDPVRQILMLLSGCVKLMQIGQDGSEVILRLACPGEVVGALALCSDIGHCATAQAMESSVALVWERASFDGALERFPVFRRNLLRVMESRLHEMDQRFREISTQKVAPRLSSQLVRLLRQVGKHVNGHVEITLSQAELAQLTGTTLFTVSRLLSEWKLQGIVHVGRESVLVRDLPALVAMSQGELGQEPATFRTGVSA